MTNQPTQGDSNVGSIGLPRDDGRFASFSVFDSEQSTVEIHRFSIENSNLELIKRFPDITDEVKSVFNRRDWSVESGFIARRNV